MEKKWNKLILPVGHICWVMHLKVQILYIMMQLLQNTPSCSMFSFYNFAFSRSAPTPHSQVMVSPTILTI